MLGEGTSSGRDTLSQGEIVSAPDGQPKIKKVLAVGGAPS